MTTAPLNRKEALEFLDGLDADNDLEVPVSQEMYYRLRNMGLPVWQGTPPLDYNGIRITMEGTS